MRRIFVYIALATFGSSCTLFDYTINIDHFYISEISERDGTGFVVVDERSAENIEESGDTYVYGRSCLRDECPAKLVGNLREHKKVLEGVKIKIDLRRDEAIYSDNYQKFWVKDVKCIKIEATRPVLGRAGVSEWSCNMRPSPEAR